MLAPDPKPTPGLQARAEAAAQVHLEERAKLQTQVNQLQEKASEAATYLKDKANLLNQLKEVGQAREAERAAANKRIGYGTALETSPHWRLLIRRGSRIAKRCS